VADIFGPKYGSTLFGVAFASHQMGAFFGAWLGGKIYDLTGSYDIMWWVGVAFGLFAAAEHWPISGAKAVPKAARRAKEENPRATARAAVEAAQAQCVVAPATVLGVGPV
jgi:MFS family permease